MNRTPYTYCVLRYVHDTAANEFLNIGVVLLAPTLRCADYKIEHSYRRLSETFVDFDGDQYRKVVRQLEVAIDRIKKTWDVPMTELVDTPQDAAALVKKVWPDQGGSYQCGPSLPGITRDFPAAVEDAFFRMVESRYHKVKSEHRSDDDLWRSVYQAPLRRVKAFDVLKPETIVTDSIKLTCSHTFKNGRTHIVQPLTLDYTREEAIGSKAAKWLGNATALSENKEVGTLYLLLGKPQIEDYEEAYNRAKHMLSRIPLDCELIEEQDADDFAQRLSAFMSEHKLIP